MVSLEEAKVRAGLGLGLMDWPGPVDNNSAVCCQWPSAVPVQQWVPVRSGNLIDGGPVPPRPRPDKEPDLNWPLLISGPLHCPPPGSSSIIIINQPSTIQVELLALALIRYIFTHDLSALPMPSCCM